MKNWFYPVPPSSPLSSEAINRIKVVIDAEQVQDVRYAHHNERLQNHEWHAFVEHDGKHFFVHGFSSHKDRKPVHWWLSE